MNGDLSTLVIASRADLAALWAYEGLVGLGVPARLVVVEALAYARIWDHRICDGSASIHVELDGLEPLGASTRGALNRCAFVPPRAFGRFAAGDRDYAAQEWLAFYSSWLACVPGRVLNPPSPDGLCGRQRSSLEWALLAHAAGFETYECRWSAGDDSAAQPVEPTVFVVGGEVMGCEPRVASTARRLAELAETPLMAIALDRNGVFVGADVMPDLRRGGLRLLQALARELRAS